MHRGTLLLNNIFEQLFDLTIYKVNNEIFIEGKMSLIAKFFYIYFMAGLFAVGALGSIELAKSSTTSAIWDHFHLM